MTAVTARPKARPTPTPVTAPPLAASTAIAPAPANTSAKVPSASARQLASAPRRSASHAQSAPNGSGIRDGSRARCDRSARHGMDSWNPSAMCPSAASRAYSPSETPSSSRYT